MALHCRLLLLRPIVSPTPLLSMAVIHRVRLSVLSATTLPPCRAPPLPIWITTSRTAGGLARTRSIRFSPPQTAHRCNTPIPTLLTNSSSAFPFSFICPSRNSFVRDTLSTPRRPRGSVL
ncbi:hypothetical protein C8Q72DRAFT_872064, partial [Fomitopsis betulina]